MASTADLSPWLFRLATYQYFAPLMPGRDVVEVGCGAGRGASYLARLGARSVLGVDGRAELIAEARDARALTNLEFKVGTAMELPVDDHSLDLVVVADATRAVRRSAALAEIERVLRPGGAAVFSAPSADRPGARGGASYHDLRDRLAARFLAVRMFALAPFVGATLVAYDESNPSVELDTGLLELSTVPDDDVSHYVAVCGDPGVARGFAVVQMPARAGWAAWSPELGGEGVAGLASEERRVAHAREAAALVAASGPTDDSALRLDRALAGQRVAERRLADIEQQLELAHRDMSKIQAQAETRAADAQKENHAMRSRIAELEAIVSEQERALELARQDAGPTEASDGGDATNRKSAADPLTASQFAAAVERLEDLEHTLQAERDVAHELERALQALRDSARPTGDDAEADARAKVRELLDQVGTKDAELAMLKFGIDGLRGKLRELVEAVKGAQRDMSGQSATDMAAVMDRLAATLEPFAEA